MTTLAEVEKAADALPAKQKWELFGFLKSRLMGPKRTDPRTAEILSRTDRRLDR